MTCIVTGAANGATEWHRRLGHLNWNDMAFMLRNGMASDLTFGANDIHHPRNVCVTRKLTRLSFPKRDKRSPELLGIVHTDLCEHTRRAEPIFSIFFSHLPTISR